MKKRTFDTTGRISIQEAADMFGLCDRTIRRYIASGRLTAHRVGPRVIRLDLDEVRGLLSPVGPA
jgi:excisionase family DNA binding protein